MSSGFLRLPGGLLLPESAMDVPTEDGVALRAKGGILQAGGVLTSWADVDVGNSWKSRMDNFAIRLSALCNGESLFSDLFWKGAGTATPDWDSTAGVTVNSGLQNGGIVTLLPTAGANTKAFAEPVGTQQVSYNMLAGAPVVVAGRGRSPGVASVITAQTVAAFCSYFTTNANSSVNLGINGAKSTSNYCVWFDGSDTDGVFVVTNVAIDLFNMKDFALFYDGAKFDPYIGDARTATPMLYMGNSLEDNSTVPSNPGGPVAWARSNAGGGAVQAFADKVYMRTGLSLF